MFTIYVNRKDIIKEIREGIILIGYIERKGSLQRELDLRSKKYKVVVNEA